MFRASHIALLSLVGAGLLLGGCTAPNSFRIDGPAGQRFLLPPGTALSFRDGGRIVLHVERAIEACQAPLFTRTKDHVTVSNPYWSAVGARVIRIDMAQDPLPKIPPARCLNRSVRPGLKSEQCPQDTIVKDVKAAIENDAEWQRCLPKDEQGFADDVAQVLPHRASQSGALLGERTYSRPLEAANLRSAAESVLDVEFVSLLPGATVCVNQDHTLGSGSSPWVSSAQSCVRLLDGSNGPDSVVLSRTDTENTFPKARDFYGIDEAAVFDARSWLAVRGALATLMPKGAFLYVYYSGNATKNVPKSSTVWEEKDGERRYQIPSGEFNSILPLSPVLVAHSSPLGLDADHAPDLSVLCKSGPPVQVDGRPPIKDNANVVRRCFSFRDFASIDVLRPYVLDGRVDYAPSGTLTSDVAGLAAQRGAHVTRVFRGRKVPLDFDVLNPRDAVPLAADDQIKGLR